jgi:cytoskeletal protein CcmA (bactofilin family)
MFSNLKSESKMAKQPETEHSSINLVGSGTTIKGDVFSSGDIRIDGTITGFLESKGKVVVGSTGVIEGDVVCQNADISGNVRAKVSVTDLLTLKASSRITGDILTGKLAIEPGAIFTGSCTMDKPKPGIMPKPEEKK